ncbi:LysR family transcriptional regulator [Enterococcus sp. 5H]|uniref:LysR family transcriptional regulator n=1 Tax=Enterococcus sp. 5H TaxID=1229490 RepID=UPI002302A627|nr:LysR family transcriptional regulator [Enterococcus sp. 5H]MDA9470528.1 transcriptional regulator, LysR family [Enterococcus sp. 5H]
MELNDLKIFQCVTNAGSMSEAARILGYAQSNITERIRLLEQELTTILFERTSRGVKLLPEGEKLLEYADSILTQVDEIEAYYQKRPLRIGCTQASAYIYFELAEIIAYEEPTELFVKSTDQLETMYKRSELDVVVTNKATTLEKEILLTEEVGWLSVENSEAVYLISRDKDCPYRKITLSLIKSDTATIIEVDSIYVMIDLIKKGTGQAILPKFLVEKKQTQAFIFRKVTQRVPLYVLGSKRNIQHVHLLIEHNATA